MGRKMKLDGNCGSKFITIDDEKKWALIREIRRTTVFAVIWQ